MLQLLFSEFKQLDNTFLILEVLKKKKKLFIKTSEQNELKCCLYLTKEFFSFSNPSVSFITILVDLGQYYSKYSILA